MKNALISTNYPVPNGKRFNTEAFANPNMTLDDIPAFLDKRGMGEELNLLRTMLSEGSEDELKLPSDWYKEGNIPQALHAAVWLGMVAVKSGVASGWELLWDEGVIHSLAHLNLPQEDVNAQQQDVVAKIRQQVLVDLLNLEASTPGFQRESK